MFGDLILEYAVESALMYKAVEYGAAEAGVALGWEDFAAMQAEFDDTAEYVGGEEEFMRLLWVDDGVASRELYDYLVGVGRLVRLVFAEKYGEEGEKLSQQELDDYTALDGYLMAKHILRLKPDHEEHDLNVPEGEECPLCAADTAIALGESEAILEQLEGYEGDDFDKFFDELMIEWSEDGGVAVYPDGYLFVEGDMMDEFYAATVALEIGAFSGIVETAYGFHIVHRIPINYDESPYGNAWQGDYSPLRYLVAMAMFDVAMGEWLEAIGSEFTPAYESLDMSSAFKIRPLG
jgi:hypothetical protein